MATQRLMQIRPLKPKIHDSVVRGGPGDPYFLEAVSQTWKRGSLVYGDAGGNVAICTNTSQQLTSAVLGQALTPGRNLAAAAPGGLIDDDLFQVQVIRPDDLFIANAYHTTAASAVTAQTDLWDIKGLYLVAATGMWHVDYLNSVEGANDALGTVQIVGFPDKVDGVANAIGDTYGLVIVRFLLYSHSSEADVTRRVLQYHA